MQSALHAKAKEEPGYRFYLLYDKVHRADVLEFAYRCCKANKGAAGVDGQRFEDIEAYGEGRWLGELADRLRTKTYEPNAVKRVWIPKPNSSKLRPLGVPTITERVVQTAALLVCWSRSSERTWRRSNTPTGLIGGHTTQFGRSTAC